MIKQAPRIFFLKCDHCGKCADRQPFINRSAALRKCAEIGWSILGETHACPECAAKWYACREAK